MSWPESAWKESPPCEDWSITYPHLFYRDPPLRVPIRASTLRSSDVLSFVNIHSRCASACEPSQRERCCNNPSASPTSPTSSQPFALQKGPVGFSSTTSKSAPPAPHPASSGSSTFRSVRLPSTRLGYPCSTTSSPRATNAEADAADLADALAVAHDDSSPLYCFECGAVRFAFVPVQLLETEPDRRQR